MGYVSCSDLDLLLKATGTSLDEVVGKALKAGAVEEKGALSTIESLQSRIAQARKELAEHTKGLKTARKLVKVATALKK